MDERSSRKFPACVALALCVVFSAPATAEEPELTEAQQSRVTPVVLAYRKARPAVVSISAQKTVSGGVFGGELFGGEPLDNIFPSPLRPRRAVQSLGSGVLINAQGYIVTNAHVIRQAQTITVTLHDASQLEAKLISADPACDLAVLKIQPPEGQRLPFLPLGRSDDLMVGETVIAIGNPLGYANSVTTGVISAVNRTLDFASGVTFENLVQTDAPINSGNSGGPLLNIHGEWIGINTAIRADARNIGFAIPVDMVAGQLARLLDFERINRVTFGAVVAPRHGEAGDELVVTEVREGTPAADKLAKGDVLRAIDNTPVPQISDFTCLMLGLKNDAALTITVLREGVEQAVEVQLAERNKPDGLALAQAKLGLTVREIDAELARDLRLPVESGLLVVEVEKDGPAEKIGVRSRDVLFQVAQFYVKNAETLGTLLEDLPADASVRIGILRGETAAWAPLSIRAASDK
ncbi:MAG: trypsin-like peptidase domain-containing protein [Phycisphaerae bacterium]|nr:trypsin-like peptidase domain-containing protein [Phycisphaerae bacterium]